MAGILNRTVTITTDTVVTAQTLHNLIETCTVSGLAPTDLLGSYAGVAYQATAPNPTVNPYWFCSDQRDPVLRVWAAPFNIWLTVGPDRFEIPFRNGSATTINWGALVSPAGPSEFSLASNPSLNALGFLQGYPASTCVSPGDWGAICSVGIGWCLFASTASFDAANPHSWLVQQDPTQSPPGTVTILPTSDNNNVSASSGIIWGKWLLTHNTGYTLSFSPLLAQICGPRKDSGL